MHDKLKVLLDKINLESNYYDYFNNGTLNKVVINKTNKSWCFKIALTNTLPIDFYNHFVSLLKSTFIDNDKVLNVSVIINYENINCDYLSFYYKNIIENMDNKTVKVFINNNIYFDDNIIIEVMNKVEENKLNRYINKIKEELFNCGFNSDIKILINKKENDKIK